MGLEHFILNLLKSHRGRIVVSLMSIGLCSLFGLFAWPNVMDAWRLQLRHQFCLADVIDHRTTSGQHFIDGSYDLRYAFRLEPGGPLYQQSEKGPLARKELWSSLSKVKWEEAVRSGKVRVAYCLDDPTINVLATELNSNCSALIVFGIVSAAGLAASLFWLAYLLTKPDWAATDRERRHVTSASRA
jgi:hypothetical protein